MDERGKELGADLYKLIFAYLVDQRGGQVKVNLADLDYKDCSVRIALHPHDETAVVTLMSTDAAMDSIKDIDEDGKIEL